jgi:uncharacterized protein (DUF4415 family)
MARKMKSNRENPQWTSSDVARAKPARDVLPGLIGKKNAEALLLRKPGQRGPGRKPAKVAVSIRIDPDIVRFYKSNGPGWQKRINEALRKAVRKAA